MFKKLFSLCSLVVASVGFSHAQTPLPYSETFESGSGFSQMTGWTPSINSFQVLPNRGSNTTKGYSKLIFTSSFVTNYYQAYSPTAGIGPLSASSVFSIDMRAATSSNAFVTMPAGDSLIIRLLYPKAGGGNDSLTAIKIHAGNQPTTATHGTYSAAVGALAGKVVRIKYVLKVSKALEYYIDTDNIKIEDLSGTDVGVVGLSTPASASCGLGSNEQFKIKVKNFASASVSNLNINYVINTPSGTVNGNTSIASLPGQVTDSITVTGINMSGVGTYKFKAYTALAGDGNAANDTVANVTVNNLGSWNLTNNSYAFGFEPNAQFTGWQILNANNDGATWEYKNDAAQARTGSGYVFYDSDPVNQGNDWLFSRCFSLQTGKTYTATFYYKTLGNSIFENLKVSIGNLATPAAMTQTLAQLEMIASPDQYIEVTRTFSVATAGNYFVGWKVYSNTGFGLLLDDVTIREVVASDAGIKRYISPVDDPRRCIGEKSFEVTVKNYGTTAIEATPITIRIKNLTTGSEDFSTITHPNNLNANDTANVVLGTYNFTTNGVYELAAYSDLSEDGDRSNDTLKRTWIVEGGQALPTDLVDFTGYNSENLSAISPQWYEANKRAANNAWEFGKSYWYQTNDIGSQSSASLFFDTFLDFPVKEWIIGPKITATAGTRVRFRSALRRDSNGGVITMAPDDTVRVMVSADCGATWTSIKNFTSNVSQSNALVISSLSLANFAGQTVMVGFYGTNNGTKSSIAYGFYLDDIEIFDSTAVISNPKNLAQQSKVFPNPTTSGSVKIQTTWQGNTQAILTNVAGQELVRKSWNSILGNVEVLETSKLPNGVYFLKVQSAGRTETHKIFINNEL